MNYPCVHCENGLCRVYSTESIRAYCVEGPCSRQQLSNGDQIRAMSDQELAAALLRFSDLDCRIGFCKELDICKKALDADEEIPESRCRDCLLDWIRKPAEERHAADKS